MGAGWSAERERGDAGEMSARGRAERKSRREKINIPGGAVEMDLGSAIEAEGAQTGADLVDNHVELGIGGELVGAELKVGPFLVDKRLLAVDNLGHLLVLFVHVEDVARA